MKLRNLVNLKMGGRSFIIIDLEYLDSNTYSTGQKLLKTTQKLLVSYLILAQPTSQSCHEDILTLRSWEKKQTPPHPVSSCPYNFI